MRELYWYIIPTEKYTYLTLQDYKQLYNNRLKSPDITLTYIFTTDLDGNVSSQLSKFSKKMRLK